MRGFKALLIVLAALSAIGTGRAEAALVGQSISTDIEALKEWNVIAFNNLTSYNHIDGRVFVGGNLTAGSNFTIQNNNVPTTTYGTGSLTVVGNASLNGSVNAGGGINVGGNVSGSFNNNGNNQVTYGGTNSASANNTTFTSGGTDFISALASQSADIKASLTSLSANLSALASSALVAFDASDSNNQKLTATGTGLLIYNMTEAEFEAIGQNSQLLITVPDGATLVINVAGVDIDLLGKVNRFTNDSNVIWNFYEATTVDIAQQFSGSVLGVFADITVGNAGNIDGTVVGNNILQNANGEIHNNYFQGDLSSLTVSTAPEPGTWLMLILGFGLVGAATRLGRNERRPALA